MGPTTASTALSRAQVARALRVARGAGEAAADSGVAAAPVGAPVPKAAACITAMLVVAGTLAVAGITGSPGPGPDSGELGPSATPPEGSILRGSPGTAAIQPPSSRQEHSKMFGKLTGVAAATAVGVSTAVANGQGAAVQWRVEDGGNGHWYAVHLITGEETWFSCRDLSIAGGGHLATVTSPAENDFVFALALRTPGAFRTNQIGAGPFLGGFQPVGSLEPAGGWRWVTNEAWSFSNWADGGSQPDNATHCGEGIGDRPGEHYLQFIYTSSSWNDMSATATCYGGSRPSYVTEWSADCNNDGIVDYGQCRNGSLPDYDGDNVPDCCEAGEPCVTGNHPVQWRTADGGNGHWYQIRELAERPTCTQAEAAAASLGARTIAIETLAESDFFRVYRCARSQQHLSGWQDLHRINGQWTWGSGAPLVFQSWSPGQPDFGDAATIDQAGIGGPCDSMTWGDELCGIANLPSSLFLEWSADCNNDGIVDYGQILDRSVLDLNHDGVPDCCESSAPCTPCLGDVLLDGDINGADLGAVLFYWGPASAGSAARACDFNADGQVDGADLGILLAAWGPCPG